MQKNKSIKPQEKKTDAAIQKKPGLFSTKPVGQPSHVVGGVEFKDIEFKDNGHRHSKGK